MMLGRAELIALNRHPSVHATDGVHFNLGGRRPLIPFDVDVCAAPHGEYPAPLAPCEKETMMTVERFPVEAGHIMLFALAIGDANPAYYGAMSGRTTVTAPPTFVQASAQFDPDYFLRPKIDEPWFGSGRNATGVVRAEGGGGGGGGAARRAALRVPPPTPGRGRAHGDGPRRREVGEAGTARGQARVRRVDHRIPRTSPASW